MRKQIKLFVFTALGIAGLFLFISQSMSEMPYTTTKSQDCGQYVGAPKGHVGLHRIADPEGGWQTKGFIIDSFGPMPQTAYDPNYGCYPGNARTIHRYPAFHGYYYDRPYNYRHYSEYPWNAEITEPRPYPDRSRQVGSQIIMPSVVTPAESIMDADPVSEIEPEPSSNVVPSPMEVETTLPVTPKSDPLLEDLM
ncbi:MAG: hypothetical protein IJU53_02620 [Thermoguttaceae bacterium]|nr:hypothetical protein [Thermoguttaceae bacterium]